MNMDLVVGQTIKDFGGHKWKVKEVARIGDKNRIVFKRFWLRIEFTVDDDSKECFMKCYPRWLWLRSF